MKPEFEHNKMEEFLFENLFILNLVIMFSKLTSKAHQNKDPKMRIKLMMKKQESTWLIINQLKVITSNSPLKIIYFRLELIQ